MSYQFTELKEELIIKKIVSLHYFEYMSDFTFPGESHNFWEFLYVDKGELQVTADPVSYTHLDVYKRQTLFKFLLGFTPAFQP